MLVQLRQVYCFIVRDDGYMEQFRKEGVKTINSSCYRDNRNTIQSHSGRLWDTALSMNKSVMENAKKLNVKSISFPSMTKNILSVVGNIDKVGMIRYCKYCLYSN